MQKPKRETHLNFNAKGATRHLLYSYSSRKHTSSLNRTVQCCQKWSEPAIVYWRKLPQKSRGRGRDSFQWMRGVQFIHIQNVQIYGIQLCRRPWHVCPLSSPDRRYKHVIEMRLIKIVLGSAIFVQDSKENSKSILKIINFDYNRIHIRLAFNLDFKI